MSEELTTSITKALERSGPLSLEEVQAKLPQSTEAKIRSELNALVNAKKVRRSPRGQYYLHGHVVFPVPLPTVRGGARLPSFEQGTALGQGEGFVFGGRSVAPGDSLTNKDLMSAFAVGSMRGIRVSRPTGCILLISSADNSLYKDRSHDGVFDYTGEGRYGDQEMTRGNLAIAESATSGQRMLLFFKRKPNVYEYQGDVRLGAEPRMEQQEDEAGLLRRVWLFSLSGV